MPYKDIEASDGGRVSIAALGAGVDMVISPKSHLKPAALIRMTERETMLLIEHLLENLCALRDYNGGDK